MKMCQEGSPAGPERTYDVYEDWGKEEQWDAVFGTPDPFGVGNTYEQRKYRQTLSLVPSTVSRALEVGCAEGHFTKMLAGRVSTLLAADISGVALERAVERCANHANVQFAKLDLVRAPIPERYDLIVCSEMLYYLGTIDRLKRVAEKLADALVADGSLLMAHANLVADDAEHTGFDWEGGVTFGAKTIGEVFALLSNLQFERELRTLLYRVQLFRKRAGSSNSPQQPEVIEASLQHPLPPSIEKYIVWGGAYGKPDR